MAQVLYGFGDVKLPLQETVRVLDEIVTDFIQGVSFEATRAAHHAGRQKVKFEDFEFSMRHNPRYMGKIQEIFEKKKDIEAARKGFSIEDQIVRDEKNAEKNAEKAAEREQKKAERKRAREQLAGNKRVADEISKGEEEDDTLFGDGGEEGDGEGEREGEGDELLGEEDDDLDVEADIGIAVGKKIRL